MGKALIKDLGDGRNVILEYEKILEFIEQVKPELDLPGVYVPMINQYLTRPEQWYGNNPETEPTRVCYVMPVPENAAIQNIGIGILLNIINEQMGPEFLGSVHYFPEAKMLKRMEKSGVPLFDNWLFRPLKSFDILGFSSYFSLQYLNILPMLRLMEVPEMFEQRISSWDAPVVVLGGVQAFSAECIAPLFDAYLIGEGEKMNAEFFRLYREMKNAGKTKKEFLYRAAETIQGVYLPWAYEFEYYDSNDPLHKNQIKGYRLKEDAEKNGVPLKVLKAAVEFRDSQPLTKMLVSNGPASSMTIGSLFCANSCSNLCSFCHGSQLTLPYREIPYETAIDSAKKLVENTGSPVVTPYCFNASDLSYINRFTAHVLTEQNTRVTLSSERLDTIDDDFVKATIKSGSKSFTVAWESAAPRMRHVFNKNLTESQILRAMEVMIKNGAAKIKIYNISMGPFETMEDLEYYAVLLKKINEIKKKYNSKCFFRLSFTPFNPKPHTILQWSKQNNIGLDENNNPVMLKPHIPIIPKIYEAMDNNVLIKFETPSLVQLVAYCLNYGDSRLFPVIKAMADDPDVKYLGGMGIGSLGAQAFVKHLREQTCLDLDYFIREHSADEIFPWEAISAGIDKSWLRMFYEKAEQASKTPVDQDGYLRKPCYEQCTYCGVCRSLDKTRGYNGDSRNPDGSINEMYWDPKIYGKNRSLPIFEYGNNKNDHGVGLMDKISAYLKPKKYRVMRLEMDIDPYYRYVDGQKMKYRLRKACLLAGIPIASNILAASDKIFSKAYFSGKELYEVYITDSSFNQTNDLILKKINEKLDGSMVVTKVETYSTNVKKLKNNFDFVLYSLTLPEKLYPLAKSTCAIDSYAKLENLPVKVYQRSKTKFGGIEPVIVNAKNFSYDCFYKNNDDDTWTFFAVLSGNLSVYEFAAALLKIPRRNLYRYPAIIEEFLLKSTSGSAFDMFADSCECCGKEIETNIWGLPVSPDKCLRDKYLTGFKHRDVDVSENSEMYELEQDDVLSSGEMNFESDTDTDLESYVLKTSGSTNA